MTGVWRKGLFAVGVVLVLGTIVALVWSARSAPSASVVVTVGELQTVHGPVTISGEDARGLRTLAAGDRIVTGADGRARLRLDDGTTAVVDRHTELVATDKGLEVAKGRIFLRGGTGARTEVSAASLSTVVSASALAFEAATESVRVYCADGEAVVRAGERQERLRSGETAVAAGGALDVAPEKAFNDWTGGMATPWSAEGRPHPAVGELWGRLSPTSDEGGYALAIRSHEVHALLEGEMALTHVETTYFNGGSATVTGDFRMAIPPGGIVSRFALERGGQTQEGVVRIGDPGGDASLPRLDWAGEGWIQGSVPGIGAGAAVSVIVEYAEWLSAPGGKKTYRYPMVSEGAPPLIGELSVRIDASALDARRIAAGRGATVRDGIIELRKADVRPEADVVVEFDVSPEPMDVVRAYKAGPGRQDMKGDPYWLVRAEVPAEAAGAGVTLVLVLDTSQSVAPSALDAGRAVVESILAGLGTGDRVAILTADQGAAPLGEPKLSSVDEARRTAVRRALAELRPAGATDLGAALERAADLLPSDAPGALLVYVGDGAPTVGDGTMDAIRARLARRASGIPRLAAVGTGPLANHFNLRSLVRGAGPVVSVADRADAAQAAVELLAGALEPAVSGVELDLGPTVDRIYPRGEQTVPADDSIMVVGRLRGALPKTVVVRYRRGDEVVEETRAVRQRAPVRNGDVRRRWAKARVDDILVRGESSETAADIAQRARLLTPWTSWFVGGGETSVGTIPLRERAPSAADLDMLAGTTEPRSGTLLEPPPPPPLHEGEDFEELVRASARRTLQRAMPRVRRCHAARAAHRPEITGKLLVRFFVSGAGEALQVSVQATEAQHADLPLHACVAKLIQSLRFFDSGTTTRVAVEEELTLPPALSLHARRCSDTSKLPLALRTAVWRTRIASLELSDVYLRAKHGCEIATWTEQRELLELLVERAGNGPARLEVARALEEAGETTAADYLRQAAIQRATTPDELRAVRAIVIADEPRPGKTFYAQYEAQTSHEGRLAVVRRFLTLSPHDSILRRTLFALLEALGRKDALVQEIHAARQDPFADAALLADGASTLRRIGRGEDARRAFGELIERAPGDPYARAYAGDRLRAEGFFDDATRAYGVLEAMLPEDPAVAMRQALAHAGAGRLDVASRVLDRVARTGGRTADMGLGELASMTSAVLLAEARANAKNGDGSRLERRLLEVPLPDVAGIVLVRTPSLGEPIEARLARDDQDRIEAAADLSAPSLGLFAMRLERGDDDVRVLLKHRKEIEPAAAIPVRVDVLPLDERGQVGKVVHKDIALHPDGKDAVLVWRGGVLQ